MPKSYVFHYKTDLHHYDAEAFAVRCFDDRFRDTFEHFQAHNGMGHVDSESVAGGAKIFSSPEKESDREFMFRELVKSIQLHHTKKVMLFTHHDCGAYGGFSRFAGDKEKEFTFHREEHEKARGAVLRHFPLLAVESYFIDEEGVIKMSS